MIDFDLVFENDFLNPNLTAKRLAAANRETDKKTRELTTEECGTRMDVISKTRHIYFDTDSDRIDEGESAPLLDEVAQFTNRCPGVAMQISGHTDTDGSATYNQKLSERRARAVADALIKRGVASQRLEAVGYGFNRPVADNTTREGKAQNRRIEFHAEGSQ